MVFEHGEGLLVSHKLQSRHFLSSFRLAICWPNGGQDTRLAITWVDHTLRHCWYVKVHLSKRATWVTLIGLLSMVLLAPDLESPASAATRIVLDSFTNNSSNGILQATNNGWSVGGDHFNLNNCSANVTPCMINNRLRLVNNNQTLDRGYALYNLPQTTREGIDISFNAALYDYGGSAQADGLVFYLKNGSDNATGAASLGLAGGSLGYSSCSSSCGTPGLSGALLGIGFDAYGNFFHQPFTSNSCPTDPPFDSPDTNFYYPNSLSPYSLIVKGPQTSSRFDGYCRIPTSNDMRNVQISGVVGPSNQQFSPYGLNPFSKNVLAYLGDVYPIYYPGNLVGGQCALAPDRVSPIVLASKVDIEHSMFAPDCSSLDTAPWGYSATNIDGTNFVTSSAYPWDGSEIGNAFSIYNYNDPISNDLTVANNGQYLQSYLDNIQVKFNEQTGNWDLWDGTTCDAEGQNCNIESISPGHSFANEVISLDTNSNSTDWIFTDSVGNIISYSAEIGYSYTSFYSGKEFKVNVDNTNFSFASANGYLFQAPIDFNSFDDSNYLVTLDTEPSLSVYNLEIPASENHLLQLGQTYSNFNYNGGVDLLDPTITGANNIFNSDGSGVNVRIIINPSDKTEGQFGTGYVYFGSTSNLSAEQTLVTQFALPEALYNAETFKFGFVAGTGGGALNAEIWNVGVSSLGNISDPTVTNFGIQGTWPGCSIGSATFTVSQGVSPYSVTLLNAPPGIVVDNVEGSSTDFIISGTAPPPESVEISIQVTDSQNPGVVVTIPETLVFSSSGNTCSSPPTTYTVTFDNQGHGTSPSPATEVTTLLFADLPTESTDGTFTFLGWSTTPTGSVLTGDYTPSANSILYAIWSDGTPPPPPPPVSGSLSWSIDGKSTKIFSTRNTLTLTRTFSLDIDVSDQGRAFLLQAPLNKSGICGTFTSTNYFTSSTSLTLNISDGVSPTSSSNLVRGSCYQWTQDTSTVESALPPIATQTIDTTTVDVQFTQESLTSNILALPKAISTHWPSTLPVDPRASYVDLPIVAPPTGASQIHFCVMAGTESDWSNRPGSKLGDLTGIGTINSSSTTLTFSLISSGLARTSDSTFSINVSEANFAESVTKVRITTTATNRFADLSYILIRTVPSFVSSYGIESSCTGGKDADIVQPLPGEAAVIQILPYDLKQTIRRATISQSKRR